MHISVKQNLQTDVSHVTMFSGQSLVNLLLTWLDERSLRIHAVVFNNMFGWKSLI
jgi:hypothetical protein